MHYLTLTILYGVAVLSLLSVVVILGDKAWSYDEDEAPEPVEAEMEIDLPDRGHWLSTLTDSIERIEREIVHVRREIAYLKSRKAPALDWWGRTRLVCRRTRPRMQRVIPLFVVCVAAVWMLLALASFAVLILSLVRSPDLALATTGDWRVPNVPDVAWTGAFVVTATAAVYVFVYWIMGLMAQVPGRKLAAYQAWLEATETELPYLESRERWLKALLRQKKADLELSLRQIRTHFGAEAAPYM